MAKFSLIISPYSSGLFPPFLPIELVEGGNNSPRKQLSDPISVLDVNFRQKLHGVRDLLFDSLAEAFLLQRVPWVKERVLAKVVQKQYPRLVGEFKIFDQ